MTYYMVIRMLVFFKNTKDAKKASNVLNPSVASEENIILFL
jgi:hypothetical protein